MTIYGPLSGNLAEGECGLKGSERLAVERSKELEGKDRLGCCEASASPGIHIG